MDLYGLSDEEIEAMAASVGGPPGGSETDAAEQAALSEEEEREKVRRRLSYPQGSIVQDPDTGRVKRLKPPLRTATNLEIILGQDPAFYKYLGYDEFSEVVTWATRPITDADETGIGLLVASLYGLHVGTDRVREIAHYIARQHRYHPVKDYLNSLRWDGVPRLDRLLVDYARAEDTELHRVLGQRWALSCVARVMEPGCKLDTVLVLVGGQGVGKSSLFAAMVPDHGWFSDTAMDLRHKDAYQQIQGVWIYEFAEVAALRARDAETVKAFLSARQDKYRPPYGRNTIIVPRRCVFVGTTNEPEFLDDPTGARRFWPVRVGAVDLLRLILDRDQLWAEAVELYREPGARWWLTEEEGRELAGVQEEYHREDPWREPVQTYLKGRTTCTVAELLTDALKMDLAQQSKGAQMRMAGLLTAIGWSKRRAWSTGSREWRWFAPER